MQALGCLGNVLWFIFGGIFMGLAWWLAGVLCFISIIGIPWGRACFVMGNFAFFPFGSMPVSRDVLTGKGDIGTMTVDELCARMLHEIETKAKD